MYVFKNRGTRDRKIKPRQLERFWNKVEIDGDAWIPPEWRRSGKVPKKNLRRVVVQAHDENQRLEEHEVRVRTKNIRKLMSDYLETVHGRQELFAVAEALRKEYEENADELESEENEHETTRSGTEIRKKEEKIQAHFLMFDADGSGYIDAEELGALLKELCIPIRDEVELEDLVAALDADGNGTIDYNEFKNWFFSNAIHSKNGKEKIVHSLEAASLAAQKLGRAMAGVTRVLEAKRIILACAEHDAAQHVRLLFRQSRSQYLETGDPLDLDTAAEKRFSCVRAVLGRPSADGHGSGINNIPEYEARAFRARRLLFDPQLWQLPPPAPDSLPPAWMNAEQPMLADSTYILSQAKAGGALMQGIDPCTGVRAAPRNIKGLQNIMNKHCYQTSSSLAKALLRIRADIHIASSLKQRTTLTTKQAKVPLLSEPQLVPPGHLYAAVWFRWRPDMRPRPQRDVILEAEFNGWKQSRLEPSKTHLGTYEICFHLSPGTYRYNYRVDDGGIALDPLAPVQRGNRNDDVNNQIKKRRWNSVTVLAYHHTDRPHEVTKNSIHNNELHIELGSQAFGDDGAWAVATAVRNGGGGALRSLSLRANRISGDGVTAIAEALCSGAAWGLQILDLSSNKIGTEGGRALGLMLATTWSQEQEENDYCNRYRRPAPLRELRLGRCALVDEGSARLAKGVVGHDSLHLLDLSENSIGELGASALAAAVVRNGVLHTLILSGNRLNTNAAKQLASPVRLSGSLKRLELANNPNLGPTGAAALAEALAGGSHDLVCRLEHERDHPAEFFEPDSLTALGRAFILGEESLVNPLFNDTTNAKTRSMVMTRCGSLEYLGLSRCAVMRQDNRAGIFALCQAISRGGFLQNLDLRENDLSNWAASEFAKALTARRGYCRLTEIQLEGNERLVPQWFWRDHSLSSPEARGAKKVHLSYDDPALSGLPEEDQSKSKPALPSVATSLEINRRLMSQLDRAEQETVALIEVEQHDSGSESDDVDAQSAVARAWSTRQEYEALRRVCRKHLLQVVTPAPAPDTQRCKLEGEWTPALGWYPLSDQLKVLKARSEDTARVNEAKRTALEAEAIAAASAAAAANALQEARRVPDGPELVSAVVDEIAKSHLGATTPRTSSTRRMAIAKLPPSVTTTVTANLISSKKKWSLRLLNSKQVKKRMMQAEREHIEDIIKMADADESGAIDAEELPILLKKIGWLSVTRAETDELCKKLDVDASGTIDAEELLKWWFEGDGRQVYLRERRKQKWHEYLARLKALSTKSGSTAAKCKATEGSSGELIQEEVDSRRNALHCLEADARYTAEGYARSEFRSRFPPREGCVCEVCGFAAVDAALSASHARAGHTAWKRGERLSLQRHAVIEKARRRIASMQRTRAEKTRRRQASSRKCPYPAFYIIDGRVPAHVELQSYDLPDIERGRPTGAVTFLTGAVLIVGDGQNHHLAHSAEWLRIVWPSFAPSAQGTGNALKTIETMHHALTDGNDDQNAEVSIDNGRCCVWIHNRSREFGRGRKPVLRPLRCGPTPHAALDTAAELAELKTAVAKANQVNDTKSKEEKIAKRLAKQLEAEDNEALARRRLLGDVASYVVSLRTLNRGSQLILWGTPRWYRTMPSLPPSTRLKARAIPETYGAVLGELRWGEAVLIFGQSGDWLIGAFSGRDNVWFVERSPTRLFLTPVVSITARAALRDDAKTSPYLIEHGAPGSATQASFTAAVPQVLALKAENMTIDDDALLAIGGKEQASALKRKRNSRRRPSGSSSS